MIINLLDANGVSQRIIIQSQEAAVDHSSAIVATGVAQTLLAANSLRSGWFIQNKGLNIMYVNDLGVASVGSGSFAIPPGTFFPPLGYPVLTGAISIIGTAGEFFTVREW